MLLLTGSPADITKSEPLVPFGIDPKFNPPIIKFPFFAFILKDLSRDPLSKFVATSVFKAPLRIIEVPAVISAKIVVLLVVPSGLVALEPSIFWATVKVGLVIESLEPINKVPVFLKVAIPDPANPIVVISE